MCFAANGRAEIRIVTPSREESLDPLACARNEMCFARDDAGQHRTVERFPGDQIRELRTGHARV